MTASVAPDVSVIIPTRNRGSLIEDAVGSVIGQEVGEHEFEVIVVDNASTDGTRGRVAKLEDRYSGRLRYVYERRPGLHWARHAGARDSRAPILAYTDDDAIVAPNWLAALLECYDDARVGAAGGPIRVRWRSEPPQWVPALGTFGHLDLSEEFKLLEWPETIYGGNYSVRKQVLFDVGGFNPDTSVEDRLVGDGEAGLSKKIYTAGWRIAYQPKALVYHVQDGKKITLATMRHRYAQQGRFQAYAEFKRARPVASGLLFRAVRDGATAARRKASALRHRLKGTDSFYRHEVGSAASLAAAQYFLRMLVSPSFRRLVMRDDWISDFNVAKEHS